MPGDPQRLLGWLIALPQADLVDLLATCVALTLDGVTGQEGPHPIDPLAQAVELDMADWWQPTAQGYLSHVAKAVIVQAVTEGVSAQAAAPLAGMKKAEAVAQAERLLKGNGLNRSRGRRSGQERRLSTGSFRGSQDRRGPS